MDLSLSVMVAAGGVVASVAVAYGLLKGAVASLEKSVDKIERKVDKIDAKCSEIDKRVAVLASHPRLQVVK